MEDEMRHDREVAERGREDDDAREALGVCHLLRLASRVLASRPVKEDVDELEMIAVLLGFEDFGGHDAFSLAERFDDRFYVPGSRWYVPLTESCVRRAQCEGGAYRYASKESPYRSHAMRCYAAAGFRWEDVAGDAPGHAIEPDSLAVELAFLAYLKECEAATVREGDAASAERCAGLSASFARDHACCWLTKAISCLESSQEDFFSRTVRLAELAVRMTWGA